MLGRRPSACSKAFRRLRSWETACQFPALADEKQWRRLVSPELLVVPKQGDEDPLVNFMQEIADTMLNTNELLLTIKEKLLDG